MPGTDGLRSENLLWHRMKTLEAMHLFCARGFFEVSFEETSASPEQVNTLLESEVIMSERPTPVKTLIAGQLRVEVYRSRDELGIASAYDMAARMQHLLSSQERIRAVFAAAPSQNEFLAALAATPGLDWGRVDAFHMDEYIGLPDNAPQGFGYFLRERLFDLVRPGHVEYIDGNASDPQAECERYGALLTEQPIDIICAGIGENGHMAFNDPHVADFDDSQTIKIVTLDDTCRMQQVHDGAFPTFDDVPKTALTLTMPAFLATKHLYCMVPGPTKTEAVTRTVNEPIATACPATIMRRHQSAVLYVDLEAAADI